MFKILVIVSLVTTDGASVSVHELKGHYSASSCQTVAQQINNSGSYLRGGISSAEGEYVRSVGQTRYNILQQTRAICIPEGEK